MTKHHIGTEQSCQEIATAADKLLGYPRDVTEGLRQYVDELKLAANAFLLTGQKDFVEVFVDRVAMPTYAKPRKHPSKKLWAYPVTAKLASELQSMSAADKLTPDELLTLDLAEDGAEELGKDWDPEDDQGEDE